MRFQYLALLSTILLASCGGGTDTATEAPTQSLRSQRALQVTAPSPGCAAYYANSPSFALREDLSLNTIIPLTKPSLGTINAEPNFSTCLIRASDYSLLPPFGGQSQTFSRNDYSRRQAFNSDGSYYLIYSSRGVWEVFNTSTRSFLKRLTGPAGDAELQWDAQDPDLAYYLGGAIQNKLYSIRISNNISTLIRDFTSDISVWPGAQTVSTGAEGSPSKDSRYWCLMANSTNGTKGLIVYDKQLNTVSAKMAWNDVSPNNVSMSPSGDWCVASRTLSNSHEFTRAYYKDFTFQRLLDPALGHSDIAIDGDGRDVYVGVNNANIVFMVDLLSGKKTNLVALDTPGTSTTTAVHISGKAFDKPGWAVVSTYFNRLVDVDDSGVRNWTHRKVFALQLKKGPSIRNIAYTRGNYAFGAPGSYFMEPHASVSKDFTKLLFNSNWSSGLADVDAYMVELPDGAVSAGAVAAIAPQILKSSLTNYTGNVQISTATAASCKYSSTAGVAFDDMSGTLTPSGNGLLHTNAAIPIASTVDTQIYISCKATVSGAKMEIPVYLEIPGTISTVVVHASGTSAGGVWPIMELKINGVSAGTKTVSSGVLSAYSFTGVTVREGDRLDVLFTNDATIGTEDRNLYIGAIVTDAGTLGPFNPGVTIDKGTGTAATDGIDTYTADSFGGWIPWNASMRFIQPVLGFSQITVRAKATLASNVGAFIQLYHNGAMIGAARVNSTDFLDYKFAGPFVKVGDKIDVVYTNDATINGADRNLVVQNVTASFSTGATATLLPSATTSILDKGNGIAAHDGIDTVPAATYGGWVPWNASLRMFVQ